MLKSPKAEFKALPVSNIVDKITVHKNKVVYIYTNTGLRMYIFAWQIFYSQLLISIFIACTIILVTTIVT